MKDNQIDGERVQAMILAGSMADCALLLVGGRGLNGSISPAHPDEFSAAAKALRIAAERYNDHVMSTHQRGRASGH
jgi:hypothetical protein